MTLMTDWIDKKIKDKYIHYFEYNKFSKIVEIGRGAFGKVSKADLADMGLVALKRFVDENSNIEEDELSKLDAEFKNELELLREVDYHPNINRILGITNVSESYILVLEYANEGNLRNYLKKNFTWLDWKDKIQMALDIACGLKFLHSNEIIHRDLHSKNILVNNGKLLIADLGLSKKLAEATTNSLANIKGMIEYTEPQCLNSAKYKKNKKSDIYSLGILLWEISSGHRPFSDFDYSQNILAYHIGCNNLREQPIDGTPQVYQQLYQECWDNEPNLRPDIEKVYEILSKLKSPRLQFSEPEIISELETENSPPLQSLQPDIDEVNFDHNNELRINTDQILDHSEARENHHSEANDKQTISDDYEYSIKDENNWKEKCERALNDLSYSSGEFSQSSFTIKKDKFIDTIINLQKSFPDLCEELETWKINVENKFICKEILRPLFKGKKIVCVFLKVYNKGEEDTLRCVSITGDISFKAKKFVNKLTGSKRENMINMIRSRPEMTALIMSRSFGLKIKWE